MITADCKSAVEKAAETFLCFGQKDGDDDNQHPDRIGHGCVKSLVICLPLIVIQCANQQPLDNINGGKISSDEKSQFIKTAFNIFGQEI